MGTCTAKHADLACTLHAAHKGTHYDSLRDVSFVRRDLECPKCGDFDCDCRCDCGRHPTECRCFEDEGQHWSDRVDYEYERAVEA